MSHGIEFINSHLDVYFWVHSRVQLTTVADSNLSYCQMQWLRKYFMTWSRLLNSYVVCMYRCEFGYSQKKLNTSLGGFLNSWNRCTCGQRFSKCSQRLMYLLGWVEGNYQNYSNILKLPITCTVIIYPPPFPFYFTIWKKWVYVLVTLHRKTQYKLRLHDTAPIAQDFIKDSVISYLSVFPRHYLLHYCQSEYLSSSSELVGLLFT